MRVDPHNEIDERRDAIDQRWYKFLKACGFFPVLLPNDEMSLTYLGKVSGVILSSGNSLESLEGDAPERDSLENKLISYALGIQLPILGVCRGMQMIQSYFGIQLQVVHNHIGIRHDIDFNKRILNVNSYHKYGTFASVDDIMVQAKSEDGVIEAICHKTLPLQGIMWHPEREQDFCEFDKQLFKNHFHT
jgi:gamma-glutamyl-gamma-aminobutyrate hydrolase PuuD